VHGSNAVLTCIDAVEKALIDNDTDKLITVLSVTEPLLINRENGEKCVHFEFLKKIGLILINNKWQVFDALKH